MNISEEAKAASAESELETIKSLSMTLAEYFEWAAKPRTFAEFIEYKLLLITVDLRNLQINKLQQSIRRMAPKAGV